MDYNEEHVSPSAPCIITHMNSPEKKTIFYMGDLWPGMEDFLRFDGCEYSNCIMQTCDNPAYLLQADAVIFAQNSPQITQRVPEYIRQRQLWFIYGVESPSTPGYSWNSVVNDFNGTLSYIKSSVPFSVPYGRTYAQENTNYKNFNFAKGKTKGAYAYVSNCNSKQYDRLDFMKQLSAYVDVDVFGGCTKYSPCRTRFNTTCMSNLHSKYRFYLAFENSLCTEYITEKFWRTFESDKYFVPVAFGGLSIDEYDSVAPPNSFIHAYNFSSVAELGKHLQYLMHNDEAYNRYHRWRESYYTDMVASKPAVCNFCKIINKPEMLASTKARKFADEWNDPKNCQRFTKWNANKD
ncbi:alpha-(1,3)-fucosyltransferase fut-1-like [Watersipora subatra]|uniref:alpha-(1,3)-fucosyltransferase fut-1-like n=1 Tax=Watersipora subatra TaxID=2589382 RepID=UPI00355BE407